jgi:hypothetical protein
MVQEAQGVLVIACGALAHDIAALRRANQWLQMDVSCLPPELHNRPEKIPGAVREQIHAARGRYQSIFVAYGDCGTGGELDRVLAEEEVERLPGAHCYAFYAGLAAFDAMQEEEVGTFYLTDFLAQHFQRLMVEGLGLDRHPELFEDYFRHYRRLVYLAQAPSPGLLERAHAAAAFLKLPLEIRATGYGLLEQAVVERAA